MSKYKKLEEYFETVKGSRVRLTYKQINEIMGSDLPLSSYASAAWWSEGKHDYANAWLETGWKVEEVGLGNYVDFGRENGADDGGIVYNKLVRDGIPKIIEDSGRICDTRIAQDEEKLQLLKDKLNEEVREFVEDNDLEELADIMEVVMSLAESLGFTQDDLLQKWDEKRVEKGSFKEGVVLLKVYDK